MFKKFALWYSPDEGGGDVADSKEPDAEGNGGEDRQSKLDQQFAQRARRAEEAERKRLLEAASVKDEEELKAVVKAKKEADDAAKSELQKAADRAVKVEQQLERLKT